MPVSVSEKKIKSKIKSGEKTVVIENIRYPYFEDEKNKKLCRIMNDFYSSVAERYSYHARIKLPARIKSKRITCRRPVTLAMNYTLSFCDESIISIVLDLSFTRGQNVKMRRFSQIWSVEKQDMLVPGELIKTDRASKKRILSQILSIAKENGKNDAFGYYGDYLSRLSKHFDIRNVFVVPKGLCFFVNAGILSPVKYGANNFVLQTDGIEGLIEDSFLPKQDVNAFQNKNIVNNI